MKNSYLLIGAILLITAVAWWNTNRDDKEESSYTPAPSAVAPPSIVTTPMVPSTGKPTGSEASSGALNPAHGQPGHRCDLAVGAPLPTAGSPVQIPTPVTTAPAPTPTPPVAVPTPTTAGGTGAKNPEHGQPGHRCDIAVGAPLNSKPAATPISAPTPTPAPVSPVSNSGSGATTGRNPAHGQPNHRCDLPVGASFDSANAAQKKS